MNGVAGQQEQVQICASQLAEGEVKLALLAGQLKEVRQRRQALESQVTDLVGKLEF